MMSPTILSLVRVLLVGAALFLTFLIPVPRIVILGICLVCILVVVSDWVGGNAGRQREKLAAILIGVLSVLILVAIFFFSRRLDFFDNYYALIAWMIAGSSGITTSRVANPAANLLWRLITVGWLFLGEFVWLAGAYLQNRPADFYLGVFLLLALLLLCKWWFHLPDRAILCINTAILFLIFLPLVDLVVRPKAQIDPHPDVAGKDYLYSESHKDPKAYARYASKYAFQILRLARVGFVPDADGRLPYVFRTNTDIPFFGSTIHINADGFRGDDIKHPKDGSYRILALGESTTFGITLTREHEPWPVILAGLIRSELKPARPFEIINGGMPGFSLEDNLVRLERIIHELNPDLIISYHGYNGFFMLYPALPRVLVERVPARWPRPLWLLAECEYRLRVHAFRRRLTVPDISQLPSVSDIMRSKYAQAYEALVALAKTNLARLVIANYSMAVNASSAPEVKEFYRNTGFPSLYPAITVNELHSLLVANICQEHPETIFVDTHPELDGRHDLFTDLVHFDPEGDRRMAKTVFGCLSNFLSSELCREGVLPLPR